MGEVGVMRRRGLVLALALAGAACSSSPKPAPPPKVSSPRPAPIAPKPAPVAQTPIPQGPPPDQCGAYELTNLVGKLKTEIPVPVDPGRRRVYCSTCMVTMDYDPTRLNIVFDVQTGLITQVKCG